MASGLIGRVGNCCGGIVADVEVNRISVSRSVVSVLDIGTPPDSRLEKRGELTRAKTITNESGASFREFLTDLIALNYSLLVAPHGSRRQAEAYRTFVESFPLGLSGGADGRQAEAYRTLETARF